MGILSLERAQAIERNMVIAMERELRTIIAAQDMENEMNELRADRAQREMRFKEKREKEQRIQSKVRAENERMHREKRERVLEHQEDRRRMLAAFEKERQLKVALRAKQIEQERQLQAELIAEESRKKAAYMAQVRQRLEEDEHDRKLQIFQRMKVSEARLEEQHKEQDEMRQHKMQIQKEKEAERHERREQFNERQAEMHKQLILKIADKYTKSDRMKQEQSQIVHSLNKLKKAFADRKDEVCDQIRIASRTGNMEMIYDILFKVREPSGMLDILSSPVSPRHMAYSPSSTATKFLQQYGLEETLAPPSPRPAFSPPGRKQASLANSSPPASPQPLYPMSATSPVSRPSIRVPTLAGMRRSVAAEESPWGLSGRSYAEESPARRSVRTPGRVTVTAEDDDMPEPGETYKRLMTRLYASRGSISAR